MEPVDDSSNMYLTMAGCCASFSFFLSLSLIVGEGRDNRRRWSLTTFIFRVTGLILISVKSLLRGNAVEDSSTDLRTRGVFVIGANVLFAYQRSWITPATMSARPTYPVHDDAAWSMGVRKRNSKRTNRFCSPARVVGFRISNNSVVMVFGIEFDRNIFVARVSADKL